MPFSSLVSSQMVSEQWKGAVLRSGRVKQVFHCLSLNRIVSRACAWKLSQVPETLELGEWDQHIWIWNSYAALTQPELSIQWHRRYGHLNYKSMQLLSQGEYVHGLPSINSWGLCEGCIKSKQARHFFPTFSARSENSPLELLHGDLCGPMQT